MIEIVVTHAETSIERDERSGLQHVVLEVGTPFGY